MCAYFSDASGQTEFAPLGATWTHQKPAFFGPPGSVDTCTIRVTGIDTIMGIPWKRLEGCFLCAGGPVEHIYQEGSKVYRYRPEGFSLIYDFAALPGTSWSIHHLPGAGETDSLIVHVDSISTIWMGGDSLQVQYVSTIQEPYLWDWGNFDSPIKRIIEGVGMVGMIFPSIGTCDPQTGGLRCYESDVAFYQFSDIACDSTWLVLSSDDLNTVKNIKVFPNPSHDWLRWQWQDAPEDARLKIFNLQGILLQEWKLSSSNSPIDIRNWSNGVYICIFESHQQRSIHRILKISDR